MVKRLIILLTLLVLVFGGLVGIKYTQMQKMAAQMAQPLPPATVAALRVAAETWRPNLRAVGSLVAVNGIAVTTEVPGIVSDIQFASGDPVEQGAVLVRLDDAVDQAGLAALRADRQLAAVQFKRSQDLLPKRAVSQSDYDETKAKYDAAQARVAEQQAVIDRKTVRAPFTGLLGIRAVDLGQYIEPGDPIVDLEALDPIYVDYNLPERYLLQVAAGQEVQVRLDALPGETFTGRISALDPGVDQGTRTVKIRATLANPDGRLRPGMFAEVLTIQAGEQQVLTVPRTAISFNTYGDFAFVIEEDTNGTLIAKRRQVVSGETRAGRVAISRGLHAGERVVRAGITKLRDGQPVQIDNAVELTDAEVVGE